MLGFVHIDHLGSVGLITNENGTKVEAALYSPFGEIVGGGAVSRYDYTGKKFDSVFDDYDFNARRMNSQLGKFIQPDSLLPNIYDPQQLNRYSYVRSNPYKYVDKNGNVAS